MFTARKIVILGLLGALLIVAQVALSPLPNIEIVSLLVIVFTLILKKRVLAPLAVFIAVEGLIYGFGIWWFTYLYTWPFLSLCTYFLRNHRSAVVFTILGGAFGLLFGALCSLLYLMMGGLAPALAFFIAGIPFDILHCIGNILTTAILFKPCFRLADRLISPYFS